MEEINGSSNEFDDEEHMYRIDIKSDLEKTVPCLCIPLGLMALVCFMLRDGVQVGLNFLLAMVLVAAVSWFLDCSYFLNKRDRTFEYRRSLFGLGTVDVICGFDEIFAATVTGFREVRYNNFTEDVEETGRWLYVTIIVGRDGKCTVVSDPSVSMNAQADIAKDIARITGARFIEAEEKKGIQVKMIAGEDEPVVCFLDEPDDSLFYVPVSWLRVFGALALIFFTVIILPSLLGVGKK